jgi:hypothetical protein
MFRTTNVSIFAAMLLGSGCRPAPAPAPPPDAPVEGGYSGCQASCPSPPAGCERTSIDPGYCGADSGCTAPPPVCHYKATAPNTDCPPTLTGRCIPAN